MEDLHCPICLGTLKEPVTHQKCGRNFCKACLLDQKRNSNKCPLCRDLLPDELAVNRGMEFAIGLIVSAKKPVAKVIHPGAVQTVELPLLGEGSFGQVRLGSYDGNEVAVKTLSGDARCVSDVLVANLAREAALLCNLRHPNILPVFGVVKGADGSTVSSVCALAANGSLEQALRGSGIAGAPNPIAARQIAIGIARSLTLF